MEKFSRKKRILCFGDSNTWGFDASTGERFSESVRWTSLLQEAYGEKVQVIEEGLSGRTSVFQDPLFEGLCALDYIHPCILSHSPLDVVVIMLGTNDTKERFRATSYNIAQGIVRLAQKTAKALEVQENNCVVIIVSPPPIHENYRHTEIFEAMGEACDRKSNELGESLATLIAQHPFEFVDASHIPMNTIDYMHLDEEGHKLFAQLIFNKLESLLKK